MAGATEALGEPMKVILDLDRRYTLWIFNFGLACCAVEFVVASMSRPDLAWRQGRDSGPGPDHADLIIISGTVTDRIAPAIKRRYQAMPGPRYVMSFGACSNCGGPYWDSYSVTKGIDQIIPVDIYVPGCPPRPQALWWGIRRLQEKISTRTTEEPPAPLDLRALTAPTVRPPE